MSKPLVPLDNASIIVLAFFGRDAQTIAGIIERTDAHAQICGCAEQVGSAFDDSTAAIIATEESLAEAADTILVCLDQQPAWSDVPLIVLSGARGRTSSSMRWNFFRQFGNVTVLDRPLSGEALMIALEAACRGRAWQYVVRDQMKKLGVQNIDLERKVRERTQALKAETDERKRIEAALNEARRLEAIGRLTGGVAHDFNNLLQVISGACNLLPYVKQDPTRVEKLQNTIVRATERGSKLTQQMLAFGRRQVLATDALNVAQHVMAMKELLQQALREKIRFDLHIQADLWHAYGDLTQLEVAILNLMVNAKDVLPAGGVVTLEARNIQLPTPQISEVRDLKGDFIWLSITDNGPGMPPEVAAQAFEPFFTTKRVGEGSGLGLSQVYGFAKQSGGSAWIRSSTRGTSISILLPRSNTVMPVVQELSCQPLDKRDELHGTRVLYVEDDEAVGEIGVALLGMFGCTVDWARDADEALKKNLQSYDLVFSDVQMPGSMDGIALAKEIEMQRPNLPVLLASGYVIGPDRVRELKINVIAKPYDANVLRSALLTQLA